MLDRELEKGEAGRVAIKVNALNSREVMEKLIECSQAGVKVELFIRGICSLRPGIPDLTENITVSGIIGRWLEHSRIYSFGEGKDQRLFIGSGDMLNRNLDRRVEAFIEAVTPDTREQLNEILSALREDREKSWEMQSDGTYIREEEVEGTSSQEVLYRFFSTRQVSLTEPPAESPADTPAAVQNKSPAGTSLSVLPDTVTDSSPEEETGTDTPRRSTVLGWLSRLIK